MEVIYVASNVLSRQTVNTEVNKWNQVIREAETLLQKAENRAARLRGAIKTFSELRDLDHPFSGPDSALQI
jgi:hypothetical protein